MALSHLAPLVLRASALPWSATVWLGGHWGWATTLIWYYTWYYTFTYGFGEPDFSDGFNTSGTEWSGYTLILPSLTLLYALLGAISVKVFPTPRYFAPYSELFSWPHKGPTPLLDDEDSVKDDSPPTMAYGIVMLIFSLLVVVGSWAPYEVFAIYDLDHTIYATVLPIVTPTGLAVVAGLIFSLTPLYDEGAWRRNGSTPFNVMATFVLLGLVHSALAAAPVLVAYFTSDFTWTWVASAIGAGVLVVILLLAACMCRPTSKYKPLKDDYRL